MTIHGSLILLLNNIACKLRLYLRIFVGCQGCCPLQPVFYNIQVSPLTLLKICWQSVGVQKSINCCIAKKINWICLTYTKFSLSNLHSSKCTLKYKKNRCRGSQKNLPKHLSLIFRLEILGIRIKYGNTTFPGN